MQTLPPPSISADFFWHDACSQGRSPIFLQPCDEVIQQDCRIHWYVDNLLENSALISFLDGGSAMSERWISYFPPRLEPRMWQSQHSHFSWHADKNRYCTCWHGGELSYSNFIPRLDSSCLKLLSPSLQTCHPSTAGHKFDRLFCSIGRYTYYLSVTSLTPLVHFPNSFRHFDSRPFTGCC